MDGVHKKFADYLKVSPSKAKKYLEDILERKLVLKLGKSGSFTIVSPEPLKGVKIYDRNYLLLQNNLPLEEKKVWVTNKRQKDSVIGCILEYYNIFPYE